MTAHPPLGAAATGQAKVQALEEENERYRRALEEIGAPGGPLNLLEPNQGEQPAPLCAAVELRRILETVMEG